MRLNHSSLVLALALAGCVSNEPTDITFVSVEAVDYRSQTEMPVPAAAFLVGLLRQSELATTDVSDLGQPGDDERPHELLLKVTFTSRTNLAKFLIDNQYDIGNMAYFCNGSKEDPPFYSLSYPYIFWEGNLLSPIERDVIEKGDGDIESPIAYYMYMPVARESIVPANPPVEGFDHRQKPEDVCMCLEGGPGFRALGYRSNTLVIPKDAIAAALQEIPPGFDE